MAAKHVPEPASGPAAPGPADSGPAPHERIFVGLDTADVEKAARLAKLLAGAVGGVKIGKEFFTAQGPDGVRGVAGGAPLFLGLKRSEGRRGGKDGCRKCRSRGWTDHVKIKSRRHTVLHIIQ